jgi:cytochrome c peroxidase
MASFTTSAFRRAAGRGRSIPAALTVSRNSWPIRFNAAGKFSDDPNSEAAQRLEFLADGTQNFAQVKTPSLRNVALTAPYMHQGQIATLEDVPDLLLDAGRRAAAGGGSHGETILPRAISPSDEIADLVAFLQSLTDFNLDKSLMQKPDSPVSKSPTQASTGSLKLLGYHRCPPHHGRSVLRRRCQTAFECSRQAR